MSVPIDANEEDIKELALQSEVVQNYLKDKRVLKIIIPKDKSVISFVLDKN